MKRVLSLVLMLLSVALCAGCGSIPDQPPAAPEPSAAPEPLPEEPQSSLPAAVDVFQTETDETEVKGLEKSLHLTVNETELRIDWEDNESVKALIDLLSSKPLTVQMSMYGGFEQVGSLGTSLPRNDSQTTTQAGDIVLYSGNQIVIFYGSNSWAYTRLGRITDKSASELTELLGKGDVAVTLTWE